MEGALATSGSLVGLGLVKSKCFLLFFGWHFHTVTWDDFFGGVCWNFWGKKKTCSPPNLGVTNIKTCHPFYGPFMGKSWGQFPGLVQLLLSEVGVTIYDDGSGSTVTNRWVFFGISKNIWNSMTFVWVFKDDATLDVTAVFGYIYIFSRCVCQIEDGRWKKACTSKSSSEWCEVRFLNWSR